MSRKTTSAERGLPGSPMIGIPSLWASSVGFPGLIARPWHQISACGSPATAAAVSSRPPTDEPAQMTIRSLSPGGSPQRRPAERAVVGDDR